MNGSRLNAGCGVFPHGRAVAGLGRGERRGFQSKRLVGSLLAIGSTAAAEAIASVADASPPACGAAGMWQSGRGRMGRRLPVWQSGRGRTMGRLPATDGPRAGRGGECHAGSRVAGCRFVGCHAGNRLAGGWRVDCHARQHVFRGRAMLFHGVGAAGPERSRRAPAPRVAPPGERAAAPWAGRGTGSGSRTALALFPNENCPLG
jgi:hypothetical protein